MNKHGKSHRLASLAVMAVILVTTGCKNAQTAAPPTLPPLPLDDPDPNIRLVRAIAVERVDLVRKALAEGASANFTTTREMVFPPDRYLVPTIKLPAICIEDTAHINPSPIAEALLAAGANPNVCGERSLIGPHEGYNGMAPIPIASAFIQHGYIPTNREVEYAERALSSRGSAPVTQGSIDLANIVLNGKGPAIEAYKARQLAAQFQAQIALQKARDAFAGAARGTTVCSNPGAYRQDYVAYVEDRADDRVQLRVAGSMSGIMAELRAQDIMWDSILLWSPCNAGRR